MPGTRSLAYNFSNWLVQKNGKEKVASDADRLDCYYS